MKVSKFHTPSVPSMPDRFTDMFRALLKTDLPKEQVFAVTVGASSKRTLASWHLLAPADVIASIAALIAPRYDDEGGQGGGQASL
jgi:hypothetical protein